MAAIMNQPRLATITKKPTFIIPCLLLVDIATGAFVRGRTNALKTNFLAGESPDIPPSPPEPTTAAAMEAAITNLILGKSAFAATPMGNSVAQIADLVKKEMEPKVLAASESDQRQLNELDEDIKECGDIVTSGATAAAKHTTVYQKESKLHKSCRADEAIRSSSKSSCLAQQKSLHAEKTLKCQHFAIVSKLYGTSKNNAMIVRKGGSESVQNYVTRLSATFCGNHVHGNKGTKSHQGGWGGGLKDGMLDKYLRAKDACQKATHAFNAKVKECKKKIRGYNTKKKVCNGIQVIMDSSSCLSAVVEKDSCESYTECYSDKVAAFKAAEAKVKSQEKDRKAEWRGLKRISCYISAFADGRVTDAEVGTCRNQTHSTKLLDITYPEIPDPTVCTVTDLYPATGAYKKAEFVPLPALAKGRESAECSGIKEISTTPADGSPDTCTCRRVALNGYYSAGPMVKCTNCIDVYKATQKNSCPVGTKIFSPASRDDWKTFMASAGPLKDPYWIVDVTRPQNGCGGCKRYAMNSGTSQQSSWRTSDGSPWWLRSTPTGQPTGNYKANCYMNVAYRSWTDIDRIRFNDKKCAYHSKSYYCQPKSLDLKPKSGSPKSCRCTKVELAGPYSAENLIKCENCLTVRRATEKNSCPIGTKIFSPASREDWQTFLNSAKPLKAPHFIVDVTRPQNGCGGCRKYAMSSSTPQQATWRTSDGSPWWLRSTPYNEPSGDYTANCYMAIFSTKSETDIRFNDARCNYRSRSYYCQTIQKTAPSVKKGSKKSSWWGSVKRTFRKIW